MSIDCEKIAEYGYGDTETSALHPFHGRRAPFVISRDYLSPGQTQGEAHPHVSLPDRQTDTHHHRAAEEARAQHQAPQMVLHSLLSS